MFLHGIYDRESLPTIIKEGLRVGSNIADEFGQATSYPILLVYPDKVKGNLEEVKYRRGDYKIVRPIGKPTAIYIDETAFPNRRSYIEIAKDFGTILDRIEKEKGLTTDDLLEKFSTPMGRTMYDWVAINKFDPELYSVWKEHEEASDRLIEGSDEGFNSQEYIRSIVRLLDPFSIPVYITSPNEETGIVDFNSARQVGGQLSGILSQELSSRQYTEGIEGNLEPERFEQVNKSSSIKRLY